MKHNFFVRARHVPGVRNDIADALSRFQDARFRAAAPTADRIPCTIPPSLMTLKGMKFKPTQPGAWHGLPTVRTALWKNDFFSFV